MRKRITMYGVEKMAKRKGSLKRSYVIMMVLPILVCGILTIWFSYHRFTGSIYNEIEKELKNSAYTFLSTYERLRPGNYEEMKSQNMAALMKGSELIARDIKLLETIKEDTGFDVSFFYGELRYVTTLENDEGQKYVGSATNSVIRKEVMEEDKAHFYNNVKLEGEEYAAYYIPLHNTGDKVVGMLEFVANAKGVKKNVNKAVFPIIIITAILMVICGTIALRYAAGIINAFQKINSFLLKVEKGELSGEIDPRTKNRDDEIGQMSKTAMSMQKSIRQLVELDALTQLYNRRFGDKNLKKILGKVGTEGIKASVCIGDIDFFKKFNDTYGHDVGDEVLKEVARTLRKSMAGCGFVARWGGEEFLLVFDKMEVDDAAAKLETILDDIHRIEIVNGEDILHINMSFGVASACVDGKVDASDNVLKRADNLLYYAKEHGRNQVVAEKQDTTEE